MTTERIKEIQSKTAYPNSISVQQALLQVWNEVALESQLKIAWHKYPEEVPKDISDKWITIKDGTTDISWYNKKSQAENLHWDGFLDEDIIAFADITYPEPYKEEK